MQELSEELNLLSHDVIGAAIEVHRVLGPGFLERSYQRALAIELRLRGIPHTIESPIQLEYKGESVGEGRIDILIRDQLVIELKTVDKLAEIHDAQALAYLKATGHQLALLINFNTPVLRDGIKRIIRSD
ncbi:MAG: GxxExxY protein [Planctomycetota bacterium]